MGKSLALFGWLVAAAALLMGCAADTYTVGNELGWAIPPVSDSAYQTWAKTKAFEVGDTFTFTWSGAHDVAQVTKEGYDNCSATNTTSVAPIQTVSPYTFTLNSTAPQYFICTIGDHCSRGMKVTIEERSFSAASPSASAFAAIFLALAGTLSLFM